MNQTNCVTFLKNHKYLKLISVPNEIIHLEIRSSCKQYTFVFKENKTKKKQCINYSKC